MTKKEFKSAMLRGHGRCVLAVREAPEKYRDTVLWACGKNIAYDPQSEGVRSWYVYTMASAYPDKSPFVYAAAESLKRYRPNGSWDLLHISELLSFFAEDGYDVAKTALEDKYLELLNALLARRGRPNRIFYELADLEQLGLVLAVDRDAFLRIAKDFGRLYLEKPYMESGDFAWFFASRGARYKRTLAQAAMRDADVACFLEREQESATKLEEMREQRETDHQAKLTGVSLSLWLAKKADKETVERYAASYREQVQPILRAEALSAFCCCTYPDDPTPVIEDTHSDCEELKNAAWRALEHIRHPKVRDFALDNFVIGIRTPENLALLTTNYTTGDGYALESILRELIILQDWDGVHAAGQDIYQLLDSGRPVPHAKHLLPLLYEYTPCSFCREAALSYMSKRRLLNKQMLEECLYDSNDEIRKMAEKRLGKILGKC